MPSTENKCNDCAYASLIEELKRDSERNSEQHREFYKKFGEQNTAIAIADERYTNLLQTMNRLENSINSISGSLEEIKEKPGKKWDNVVMTIITIVITAVVTFILAKFGL